MRVMKKVLIVTERFWPEEFIVNDLATEAAKLGNKVTVLTQQASYPYGRIPRGRRNSILSRERWNEIEVIRFKTVLGYRDSLFFKILNYLWFAVFGSFVALGIKARFDSVLIYQTGPLTMCVPGIVYGKIRHVSMTIWTQDIWPDSIYAYGFKKGRLLSLALDAFVRWVYGSMVAVLVSCRGFADVLKRYTKIAIIYAPNWALSTYEEPCSNTLISDIPIFLFAGNVGMVQNLENVIKGYAKAKEDLTFNGILRIVGDGSALAQLRHLAEMLAVNVEFPGRIHSSKMNEEYARASYLILSLDDKPAFRITVPSKFQMYLSVGKPILCAAEGEVRQLVRECGLGVDADARSPESIAAAFKRLACANKDEVNAWKKNAKTGFEETFSRTKIIETILAAIGRRQIQYR